MTSSQDMLQELQYCTVFCCRYAPGVEMADHAFHQQLATQLRAELARETQLY